MLTVKISTVNAAFGESPEEARAEIARILSELSKSIASGYDSSGVLRDFNGNTVGSVKLTGL